jgi:ubiquinone/menaquinone biosynthesis C-methylase UbiE
LSYPAASALGEHLQISKARDSVNVLDIAAGSGVWGIALAKQSPNVKLAAVDWPDVLKVTDRVARRHGVGNRLTKIPGDLLKVNYGNGHHIATLGHILHSEGPSRSRKLLKKTFDALSPGGTIAIAEFMVNDDRTGPPMGLLFAVNMLVNTRDGDTFSFKEMSGWLREAGFRNPRLLEVPAVSPLVLATKPG